jgi:predicted Rossmann fold flavoprotein
MCFSLRKGANMKIDVVIIGGGPSGLMAAYQLHEANINYVILDKNPLLGKKLLITGQGRCNVTNHLNTNQFIAQLSLPHKKFLYSSLSAFGTSEVVSFFESNGVPLYQDGELKYFPKSNKAIDIRDVFANKIGDRVNLNTTVEKITFDKQFTIKTNRKTYVADKVIIATGSKSFPKTGSTGYGNKVADSFGIETRAFYPAETSIYSTFVQKHKEYLQGISIQDSKVAIKGTKISLRGDLLFTHFGLSGPAIFHLSETIFHELKNGNNVLEVSLANEEEATIRNELEQGDSQIHILKFLEQYTYKRVSRFLLDYLNLENQKIAAISQKKKNQIIDSLYRFNIKIDAVEDITKAYVNGGGVLAQELHPKSFESKKVPGLYFIGEAVDIHGPIGGFNITIAFASGYAASKHIIKALLKI